MEEKVKTELKTKVEAKEFFACYNNKMALNNINFNIFANKITAIIGPSGCGKSTFLRSINRMNDLIENFSVKGELLIDGKNIYDRDVDVILLRKKVGMVFQKPNPFPKTIFENIAYGLRIHRMFKNYDDLYQQVENSLKEAALWDEVKEDLNKNAFDLSGGQQQRLCIARALVIKPEIILMDEPTASLDPISTAKIEELIRKLKEHYTIVIVTHNMQQAARVSDYSAFFMQGEMIEYDETPKIFTSPSNKLTEEYITGRFG